MQHMWLREFVGLVAQDLGVSETDLRDDERFLSRTKTALDAVAARQRQRSGTRGAERFGTLGGKHRILVETLLRIPPLPAHPGRVAWAAAQELLRRGGAEWTDDGSLTVLRYDHWARQGGRVDAEWMATRVHHRRRAHPRSSQPPLFALDERPIISVYLSGPLLSLRLSGDNETVARIHGECDRELRALQAELGNGFEFRLLHPSADVPAGDPKRLWDWDIGLLEDVATVLVVADLGAHPAGFGAACEVLSYARLPGMIAYISSDLCEDRSRYTYGLIGELGIERVRCPSLPELPRRLRTWVRERMTLIVDAARRRDDAVLLAEPLHRRLNDRWPKLNRRQRGVIYDMLDLTPLRMPRILESASAFAQLSNFSHSRLRDLLGAEEERAQSARPPIVDVNALFRAARAGGWPAGEIHRVFEEAAHLAERAVADVRRAAFTDEESFALLHHELFPA